MVHVNANPLEDLFGLMRSVCEWDGAPPVQSVESSELRESETGTSQLELGAGSYV